MNWTSTKQGGYTLFGHQLQKNDGIDPIKKEAFKLLEAFCIFGYQEFYKNLLCILVFMHQRNYGKESLVPTQILKMFKWLDNELVIDHLKWHFKPTRPLSFYHLDSINDDMTVHCTKICPIQFKFGEVNYAHLLWQTGWQLQLDQYLHQ
jgi:hypothetical protein